MDKLNKDITFFIPCFNEEKNILKTYQNLISAVNFYNFKYEILIVDDGSTDDSYKVIKKITKNNKNVFLKKNKKNLGLGKSYFKYANFAKGKFYMLINGDNTEPKNSIVKILKYLGKSEIIIPYFDNLDVRSKTRKHISKMYTLLVNVILGLKVKYYNGPVVHLTKNIIQLKKLSAGYGYQTEILASLLKKKKSSFTQVKVKNSDRTEGLSKAFRLKNIFNVMMTLIKISKYRIYE